MLVGCGDCQSLYMVTGVGCSSANFSLETMWEVDQCSLVIGGTVMISVGKMYDDVY